MSAGFVIVYECRTSPEAGFISALFTEAGLRVEVHGDSLAALDLVPQPIQILVHPEDLEAAERLLDREARQGETEDVRCSRCKSTNEAHFTLCWNCGKELE